MDSTYMKACLSAYFRFKRQSSLIATEVGAFSSDFLAITKGKLVEVEIKVSKSDLRNDFKKQKHKYYKEGTHEWVPTVFYFAVPPDLVEYAVDRCADTKYGVIEITEKETRSKTTYRLWCEDPDNITEDEINECKRNIMRSFDNPTFLKIERGWGTTMNMKFEFDSIRGWDERVRTIKKAKALTGQSPSARVKNTMVKRLSSEMSNLRIKAEIAKTKTPGSA